MYEQIKHWFIIGLWSEKMVVNAMKKGVLTEEQIKDIIERGMVDGMEKTMLRYERYAV